jgi:hypothetical protein
VGFESVVVVAVWESITVLSVVVSCFLEHPMKNRVINTTRIAGFIKYETSNP